MKYISVLAFVSMPLVVCLFVLSDNIIRLVLGQQWIGASEIFKILAFAALIQPVASSRGLVLLSTGKSRKYLWWGILNAVVIIISFLLGIPWGPKGVATGYAIANYIILYPSLIYVFNNSPVRVKDFFISIYKPFMSSIAMGSVCFFLQRSMNQFPDIAVITVCFFIGFIIYCLAFMVLSGGSKGIREYYSYGRLAFGKK